VLEVGEYEGRLRNLADLVWAVGDVLDVTPSGEQGEAALAQAVQRPLQYVAGC